jgi:hypothetical protein
MASAWATVAGVGETLFGQSRDDIGDLRERYLDRRGPAAGRYGEGLGLLEIGVGMHPA